MVSTYLCIKIHIENPNFLLVEVFFFIAESSTEGKADRRRNNFGNTNKSSSFGNMNNSNANGDDKYGHFQPNMRGHYTLCYPKFKENDDVTKEVGFSYDFYSAECIEGCTPHDIFYAPP